MRAIPNQPEKINVMEKFIFFKQSLMIIGALLTARLAYAASGPLAKDFGADDWLDKMYVVYSVVGLVVAITLVLVFLILRRK